MLYQMIYSSEASGVVTAQELEHILVEARVDNATRAVTGVLIYSDGVFLQVLEGDRPVLETLVDSIARDGRHQQMKLWYEKPIDERAFASWRMAYLSPNIEELSAWAGLKSTQSIQDILAHVQRDTTRVPRILVSILKALAD